jgi:hypothetical protein
MKAKKEIERRDRSTIQFPYYDLDHAVGLAKAIFQNGGGRGSLDQIAAWTKHNATDSGPFRLKVSTARMFGLIEGSGEAVALTDLGMDIVDPQGERSARARAFLRIPLYLQLYTRFKGQRLPGDPGLETQIASLGVAPKQKDKARRVFQRSARQAEFFAHGSDRLIAPGSVGTLTTEKASSKAEPAPEERPKETQDEEQRHTRSLHPFVQGLLDTLPDPKNPWPSEERKKWLETAERIFSLMYKEA